MTSEMTRLRMICAVSVLMKLCDMATADLKPGHLAWIQLPSNAWKLHCVNTLPYTICCDSKKNDNSCVWLSIDAGPLKPGSAFKSGRFQVVGMNPTPTLWTPLTLTYVQGYTIGSVDLSAREMIVVMKNGVPVGFRFDAQQSIGYPYTDAQGSMKERVLMVDAEGWATTNSPAYYDLYTGNGGEKYRFVAATNSENYLDMVLYRDASGREETREDAGVEVIRGDNGAIRQVLTPSRLNDVVTEGTWQYSINIYRRVDISGDKNASGFYLVPAELSPVEKWTISNPDTNSMKHFVAEQVIGTSTNRLVYEYFHDVDDWTLTLGNGLVKHIKERYKSDTLNEELIVDIFKNDKDELVQKKSARVQQFSWGGGVVEEVTDPAGVALRTTYSYYESGPGKGNIKTIQRPDGSWIRYEYATNGNMSAQITPWKDASSNAPSSDAHVIYNDYTPFAAGDSPGYNDQRPRTITEEVCGVAIAKTFHAYVTNAVRELQEVEEKCASPDATYGAAGNLRTVKTYLGTNVASHLIGRLKSVQYADGRLDTYDYEFGIYQSSTNPASCSFTSDSNGGCWRETVTHGTTNSPAGIAGKTKREVRVLDGSSQEVLSEVYVYTGTNYVRVAWTVQQFNDFYKPVKKYRSTGEEEDAVWAACGCTKQSDKDATGTERSYGVDLLNRVISDTKSGQDNLTRLFTYDALDRPLSETITAGTGANIVSLLTSSNSYDLAGRLLYSVDSLGLTNRFSYQNGGRSSTVARPGGLTNVTEKYLDGRAKCTRENGVVKTWSDYGANADGTQWTLTYVGPAGTNSPMWSKTVTDLLGRTIREEKPAFGGGTLANAFFFNAIGQLVKTTSPGHADAVYTYDELGQEIRQGRIEGGVTNWLAGSEETYETDGSDIWQVRRSLAFPVDNDLVVTTDLQRLRLTGLSSNLTSEAVFIDVYGNQTVARAAVDRAAKTVTQVVDSPDSTNDAVNVMVNGLIQFSVSKTCVRTDYAYDALERQTNAVTQSAGGTRSVGSVTHYNAKGQVEWTADAAGSTNSFVYDPDSGRLIAITNALGEVTHTEYNVQGQVTNTWGATYPVAYVFDDYGRMSEMHTWRQDRGLPDVTRWMYDEATGLLTNKVYSDGMGPVYSYTPDGKLASRIWARGVTTEYFYASCCGALTNITYSDGTPAVSFTLDRLGRPVTITDGQGTRTNTYDPATLALASETIPAGDATPSSRIDRQYDALGRAAGISLDTSYAVAYGYDGVGRFSSVSSSVFSVTAVVNYTYLQGVDLLAGWTNDAGLAVSRAYEPDRDLLLSVSNTWNGATVSTYTYVNDALGQRTSRIDNNIVTNNFGYNSRSELTSALIGTNAFGYAYDPIGNRQTGTNNAKVVTYVVNALNQYTNIVDGVTNTPTYDLDGNVMTLGGWTFGWDGENRLVSASNGSTLVGFAYDYMSRRIAKTIGGITNRYLYDGWAMISEVSSTTTNQFVYGLDLSGSLQGAGTIGGLLSADLGGTNAFYCYDANGNVTELVDAGGTNVAAYVYDPYGNTITKTGPLADANRFRFSSKYTDQETGLVYYGFRYYHPDEGRWLSRDPIEASRNLYILTQNDPLNRWDLIGLHDAEEEPEYFSSEGLSCCGGGISREDGADYATTSSSRKKCCDNILYNPETHCCKKKCGKVQLIEKDGKCCGKRLWFCKRKLQTHPPLLWHLGFGHCFVRFDLNGWWEQGVWNIGTTSSGQKIWRYQMEPNYPVNWPTRCSEKCVSKCEFKCMAYDEYYATFTTTGSPLRYNCCYYRNVLWNRCMRKCKCEF